MDAEDATRGKSRTGEAGEAEPERQICQRFSLLSQAALASAGGFAAASAGVRHLITFAESEIRLAVGSRLGERCLVRHLDWHKWCRRSRNNRDPGVAVSTARTMLGEKVETSLQWPSQSHIRGPPDRKHGFPVRVDDMTYQLAQVNMARLRAPLDAPELIGFVTALDPVNASADIAPGFVWRLQTEDGNATAVRAFEWDTAGSAGIIVNLSVWRSIGELADWVYGGLHRAVLRRRRE